MAIGIISSFKSYSAKKTAAQEALGPICLVSGEMKPAHTVQAQGFENINNMVRLHFNAKTVDECREIISEYCHSRLTTGYTPSNMIMTFRLKPSGNTSERFSISSNCIFDKLKEN